jgi:CRP-like cAMP-binding protein
LAALGTPHWPAHTFLGRLDAPAAEEAVCLGRTRRYRAADRLLREGEPGDEVLLLLSGMVKVLGSSGTGDVLVALRVAGDIVGELAVLNGQARSATVVACHSVYARRIARVDWEAFLRRSPSANVALARVLGDRLSLATRRQIDLSGYRAPVRVARILLDLARSYGRRTDAGVEIALAFTQPELAGAAGCSEALLRRVLKELREDNILATAYRRYTVLDPLRLARQAGIEWV